MVEKSIPRRTIIWQQLKPNWVTYIVIALIGFLAFLYAVSLGAEAATPEVVGLFCAGPIFFLPLIALALKSPPVGRVYSLGCAAIALAFTGLVTAVAVTATNIEGVTAGAGLFFAIFVPFSLILLISLFIFLRRTVTNLRQALHLNQVRQTAELIDKKGKLTFSEMGLALNTSPDLVDNLVDEVKQRELTAVQMYAPFQRVYQAESLKKEQQKVANLIQEKGQLYLDDIAIEMQTPMPLITEWIYQLVHQNRFSGFINWETAVLYSSNAAQLRESSRCPNCNGQLGMDGERVRCQHCNSEILLGGS